ncbi:MAG: GTP-binding protein [Promethearchaeota archaeon]
MVEYHFKLILIGPGSVGKTSLLNRFVHDHFSQSYQMTMGVDFLNKKLTFEEDEVTLTIWDVGGQDRFKAMRTTYYSGTGGAMLVFDLTRPNTFEKIKNTWYPELTKFCGNNIPFLLIGNKVDLIKDVGSTIKEEKARIFAETKNSIYIKTSAKSGQMVEDAFLSLTKRVALKNDIHLR